MRISDWSSDVCSSDLVVLRRAVRLAVRQALLAGWTGVLAGRRPRHHRRPGAGRGIGADPQPGGTRRAAADRVRLSLRLRDADWGGRPGELVPGLRSLTS